jgi:hypothetical protein
MNNVKTKIFTVFLLLLLSFSISSVVAQSAYQSVTSNIAISSDGTCIISDDFGVTYNIQGTPGATGTVTTDVRNGNPQPTASIPAGISLTHFVVITFNMNAADFTKAKIVIPYNDNDVQGVQPPYSIFKYNPATNSYTELTADVYTNAKTFTITVVGVDDPMFAIGGTPVQDNNGTPVPDINGGFSSIAWIVLAAFIVAIVALVVVGAWYFKKSA